MTWLVVSNERREKTYRIMRELQKSIPDPAIVIGEPPNDNKAFFVWGQMETALRLIPPALKAHRPFWHIDNGYWMPARGGREGYYRFCYRSLTPIFLKESDPSRCVVQMQDWRKDGRHILLAYPGRSFGRAIGLNMDDWRQNIKFEIRKHTKRPIKEREKYADRTIDQDLADCWALVTHSSNVAVDAVVRGIPVFVESTCPAAPVGNLSLDAIEYPNMPTREAWWSSLMCQQFTLDEMANGTICQYLKRVVQQVDGA